MTDQLLRECKKICLKRCLVALGTNSFIQFLLLTTFLLFLNFNINHPIQWLSESFRIITSFHTWLSITPLLAAVAFYSIHLGKAHLAAKHYYATRFEWFVKTFLTKFGFLWLHILVGFLTAWFYSGYLHMDYRSLTYECYGVRCLNSSYICLMVIGISASCFYFVKQNLKREPQVDFPLIQEVKWVKIRSIVYSTLYKSLLNSFFPSLWFTLVFWMLAPYCLEQVASLLNAEWEKDQYNFFSMVFNMRLLFYNWILSTQIMSNMYLMEKLFSIFLAEEVSFVIEKNPLVADTKVEISLADALAMNQLPVIQSLAALHLYDIALNPLASKREDVFLLSVPGNHPYNWNKLSGQCLTMINVFIEEFNASLETISTIKSSPLIYECTKPSATEVAEKILLRQYNEMYGIRRVTEEPPDTDRTCEKPCQSTSVQRINEYFENLYEQLQLALETTFYSIPGFLYLFDEPEGAKTAYLLANSQIVIWLIQGLAGICVASLKEDRYGVVQASLPQIIKAFVQLKGELDKLQNVILNGIRMDRNLFALKNAVKRSLYQIATVFGDYLDDLVDDPLTLRTLHSCLNYQNI